MSRKVPFRERDSLGEAVTDSSLDLYDWKEVGKTAAQSAIWPGMGFAEALLNDETVKSDYTLERDIAKLPLNETPYGATDYKNLVTERDPQPLEHHDFAVEKGFEYTRQRRGGCGAFLGDMGTAGIGLIGAVDQAVEAFGGNLVDFIGPLETVGVIGVRGLYGGVHRYSSIKAEKQLEQAEQKCKGPLDDHRRRVRDVIGAYD